MKHAMQIVPARPEPQTELEAGRVRSSSPSCGECRKFKRELKLRDEQIECLLAALRRESHHIDQRAERSGYNSVKLNK